MVLRKEGIASVSFCCCYSSLRLMKTLTSSSIRVQNLLLLLCEVLFLHHPHLQSYPESLSGIHHYYITCQLPDSVPSVPYGNICIHASKTMLFLCGCFKDATVALEQIECQNPQQYGDISQGGICVTWNCENLGKEKLKEEKRKDEKNL